MNLENIYVHRNKVIRNYRQTQPPITALGFFIAVIRYKICTMLIHSFSEYMAYANLLYYHKPR